MDNKISARKIIDLWSRSTKKRRDSERRPPSRSVVLYSTEPGDEDSDAVSDADPLAWRSLELESRRQKAVNIGRHWRRKSAINRGKLRGISRFRRVARNVHRLIKACRVCKRAVQDAVSKEEWFAKVDIFSGLLDPSFRGDRKIPRPFVTFFTNERRELKQLSFDLSDYVKDYGAEHLVTDDIRDILKRPGSERSTDQINELILFFKKFCVVFRNFGLETQRLLVKKMQYDRYEPLRIITRRGGQADGFYFILSGTAVEKSQDDRHVRELNPGQAFGEEDLKCACARRSTVVTRSSVELIQVHRQDYRAIFNLSDDNHDPRYLEYCRNDEVFHHFPLRKLLDNPSVWAVLSYKFGRLMVKDSNEMEWIYIITAGEARVLKHLTIGQIDLHARRRQIQKRSKEQDPYVKKKSLVNFIAREVKSAYSREIYNPPRSAIAHTSNTRTASLAALAQLSGSRDRKKLYNRRSCGHQRTRSVFPVINNRPHTVHHMHRQLQNSENVVPKLFTRQESDALTSTERKYAHLDRTPKYINPIKGEDDTDIQSLISSNNDFDEIDVVQKENTLTNEKAPSRPLSRLSCEGMDPDKLKRISRTSMRSGVHLESSTKNSVIDPLEKLEITHQSDDESPTPSPPSSAPSINNLSEGAEKAYISTGGSRTSIDMKNSPAPRPGMLTIPPYVQVESLHSGRVFGLRSCLDPTERGPSVSLVSAGCEVLQISKKFFMMHADDALLALINVKHRAFPTEDELIDQLDASLQWQEYKQKEVVNHLRYVGQHADRYRTSMGTVA